MVVGNSEMNVKIRLVGWMKTLKYELNRGIPKYFMFNSESLLFFSKPIKKMTIKMLSSWYEKIFFWKICTAQEENLMNEFSVTLKLSFQRCFQLLFLVCYYYPSSLNFYHRFPSLLNLELWTVTIPRLCLWEAWYV